MNAKVSAADISEAAQTAVHDAITGAEDMLNQAANSTGERAAELRAKAMQQLKALRHKIEDAQHAAVQKGKAAATATDDFVHENPWRSILAAASVGVVVGLLIGRR